MKKLFMAFGVSLLLITCNSDDHFSSNHSNTASEIKHTNRLTSNDNFNQVVKEGIIKVNKSTKGTSWFEIENIDELDIEQLDAENPEFEIHFMKYSITPTSEMPKFSSEEDFLYFIKDNINHVDVKLEYYLDGSLINQTDIEKGVIIKSEDFNNSSKGKKYPCTYLGIRECAINGIHSQNWFQMTQCVLEGVGCVIEWYVNCAIDNC